jgi:hypothetical protein
VEALHLDADLVADRPQEIGPAHERAVDAGRRHLQPVGLVGHGIVHVQEGRDGHARLLAIVHRHRPVGALRHDLDHRPLIRRDFHANEAIAQILEHGRSHPRHPGGGTGLRKQTRFVEVGDDAGCAVQIGRSFVQAPAPRPGAKEASGQTTFG